MITLAFGTSVDTSGWMRGMREGERIVDEMYRGIGSKLASMKAPELPTLGGGGGDQAGDLAAAFTPAANQIRGTIQGALGSLGPTLAKASIQIEAMAGSILATNRRLDSEVRYPAFMNATGKLRTFIQDQFDSLSGKPLQFAKLADKAINGIQWGAKLKNGLGAFSSLNRNASRELAGLKAPTLNFSPATIGVKTVAGAAEKATTSFRGLGLQIAGALGFVGVGYKLVDFLRSSIVNASNLNEQVNKTNILLGESAPAVKAFADEMAKSFGTSRASSLEVSTQIAGIGKGLGKLDGSKLSDFSISLTRLAADVSSVDNKSLGEIGDAFRIALTGEQSDIIKGLGVVINETTTKAFALQNGLAKAGKELTEQEKVLTRAAQLTQGLAWASGDLARTINDPANAYRKFTGQIENLGATLGSTLLPVVNEVLASFNGLAAATDGSMGRSKSAFEDWAASAAFAVSTVNLYLNNFDDTTKLVVLSAQQGLSNFAARLEFQFTSLSQNLTDWLTHPFAALADEVAFTALQMEILIANSKEFATSGFAGKFRNAGQEWAKRPNALNDVRHAPQVAPNLVDFSGEMAKLADRIEARRVAKPPASPTPKERPLPAVAEFTAAKLTELATFAKTLKEKVRTPLEEFGELMQKAKDAYKAGLISETDFRRAEKFARRESGMTGLPKFAAAAELGSREAASIVTANSRVNMATETEKQSLQVLRSIDRNIDKFNKKTSAKNIELPTMVNV